MSLVLFAQTRSHSVNLAYRSDPRVKLFVLSQPRKKDEFIHHRVPFSSSYLFSFLELVTGTFNRTKRTEYEYENEREKARATRFQRPERRPGEGEGGREKLLAEDRRELAKLGRLAPAIYLRNISGRTKNGHATSARFTQTHTHTRVDVIYANTGRGIDST